LSGHFCFRRELSKMVRDMVEKLAETEQMRQTWARAIPMRRAANG
jgi:hypothetical protein